ncbi:hypothetical protein F3Y22_tig00111366pilonHSYRG00071 [Hibiscus syriacus]|uniref:RRM domain-containing protein n=1 Tax=Hibiscus syriacus TaxID=106335 RepID=A0A6A2YN79_HIBSY|nr:hypothetical protein F3Y22_tig00111366pilonHSYRG00071 [Hibiscus syriacus]
MNIPKKKQVTVSDLVEEAKKRIVILAICVVGLSYLMSPDAYNSQSASTNGLNPKKPPEFPKVVEHCDWRRKVNSPVVENAIDQFTRHLISEWMTDLWYSRLTPDKESPEELVQIINGVLGELSERLRNKSHHLLTRDLINLFCSHLELFRINKAKIENQQSEPLTIEYRDAEIRRVLAAENKLHPALFSTEAEHKVLQHLMNGLISVTFRPEDLQCSFFRYIVREVLACAVIRPIINLVNPRFINERIESAVISRTKAKGELNAAQDASKYKPNGSSKIPSDHFSKLLDPSVTGVELVQLKTNQFGAARDTTATKQPKCNTTFKGSIAFHGYSNFTFVELCALELTNWGRNYKKDGEKRLIEQYPHHSSTGNPAAVDHAKAISKTREKYPTKLNSSDSHVVQPALTDQRKIEKSFPHEVRNVSYFSSVVSSQEDDHDLIDLEEVESESSDSFTSGEEETGNVMGLDSTGTKVWDGKSNRNLNVSRIHHPLENPEGHIVKKAGGRHVQYRRLTKTPSSRKRSRSTRQKLSVWKEVERTSFLSRDGQDILNSLNGLGKAEYSNDDSETEFFGRLHSGATASSSASSLSISESHSLTTNSLQNSLVGVMARELGRPSSDEEWTVFVDNLSKRVTRSELREIFIQYGKVVRVYIPNVIFKPNYKSSTFAFVQFALEKSCSRAVQNVNGTLIDGKRVSVGVAKYKKNSRGGTVGNKLQSAGNKQVIGDRGWQQVKTKKASSLRNGRTYDEVVMGDSSKNMEQVIVESEGGKGLKDNEVRNVWDMHIPNDDYGWVKYSLTGVVKYPLQPNMVKKAMAKEGFQVKIVSWGFVTNAVIVMFKSNEDFVKAWSNYRDKLFSWFQWLSPVMSEDGVPLAYGLVELVGLPLLCWNVPFLEKLAGRWGDLVCILDETRNKEDLSSARLLLRAASPYDIQESIIVGSYGRSFKVKISLGGSYYAATDVSGEELQEIPVNGDSSGKKVDSRGKSAEVVGTEVGTWGQKVVESGGFEEGGEHSLEKSSYTKSYGYGLSGNLECVMEPVSNKEYAGLGLRDVVDQSCSAQSDSNWDSFSPVTKIIPKGPAVKLKWDGLEEHNKCQSLHELIEVDSGGLRDKEGEGVQEEEENRMQMKVVSQSVKEVNKEISVKRKKRGFPVTTCMTLRAAQDGKKKKGHYARVYKRLLRFKIRRVQTAQTVITFIRRRGVRGSGYLSSLKFRRNSRKNRRGLINLALELVSINTAFSPVFSKLVEEAMATWEVSILLGISFKDGKETFIEKILCLEKGSEVVKDDGYDGRREKIVSGARLVKKVKPVMVFIQETKLDHWGDFNAYIDPEEKLGKAQNWHTINIFRTFVQRAKLIDLPMSGGTFTWSSNREVSTWDVTDGQNQIRRWQGISNVGLSDSIATLEGKIDNWERKSQGGILSKGEWDQMVEGKKELWRLLRIEESIWCQKSRSRWIKDGDRNTRFFHLSALTRNRANTIHSLKIKGDFISDIGMIRSTVFNFFKATYNTKSAMEVEGLNLEFAQLTAIQSASLEVEFSEQEVWQVISSSDSTKAPGPDGFTMGFYKKYWASLKEQIMEFFSDFYQGKMWDHGVNHTFITLIPKKCIPENIEDFRPISLVGSMYKILSKVLSKRLISCVKDIISPSQFAFIPGRQLLDCAFLANEGIDSWRKQGLKGVVFKVDFSRAYDTIEWHIIQRLMREMGFGERWCSWISQCISTASISVLVNGSPTKEFSIAKGLRQGCSLSPLLFNLVGELLHRMLSKAVDLGLFQVKSKLYGINVESDILEEWATNIGCAIGSFPTEYLGLPLGARMNSEKLWDPVIANFNKKLAGWKVTSLSLAGRLVLIKEDKKRMHWVRWDYVCRPLSGGGLGVADLKVTNRALLGKWVWKFANDKNSMWKKFLCSKHNVSCHSMDINRVFSLKDSWIWRGIVNSYLKDDVIGSCLRSHAKLQIGNGKSIYFWSDTWNGDFPLKLLFPRIFALSSNKLGKVADFGSFGSSGWVWNIMTRRNLCDWEVEQLVGLLDSLKNINLVQSLEDSLLWVGSEDGQFSVKACRNSFSVFIDESVQWEKVVWLGLVPPRVETFLWQLSHQKVAVRVELLRRGIDVGGIILCPLCNQGAESVQHLFVSCPVSWELWMKIIGYWDIQLTIPQDPPKLLSSWAVLRPKSVIWKFIPGAVFWSIWKLRNEIIFDKGKLDRISLSFTVHNFPDFKVLNSIGSCWIPPPMDYFKMNVDGAVSSLGMVAGIGGILRNWNRVILTSFSINVGPNTPILAELKAIKKGIDIFVSSVWASKGRLIVESDSKTAVEWIKYQNSVPLYLSIFVKEIVSAVSRNQIVIRWIPRCCNCEADKLAKEEGSCLTAMDYLEGGANIVKSGSRTFAVYSISVTDHSFFIAEASRFRHFEELHQRLKSFREYKLHLPPKHFLSTGLDIPVIRERCKLLDEYLKKLLQLPSVSGSIEVWDFLSVDSQTYVFSSSFSIVETLSVGLDDNPSEKSKKASNVMGPLMGPLTSRRRQLDTESNEPSLQIKPNFATDELRNAKNVSTSPSKVPTEGWCKSSEDTGSDSDARVGNTLLVRNSKENVKGRENKIVEDASELLLDSAMYPTLPTEWVPPNLTAPILDLVDVIFQLQDGGWIRRKAFWVAKQVLQLGMGDAFDDWLIEKIQLLRRGSVVASGIKRVEQILWPDGIFITKHPRRQRPPPPSSPTQASTHPQSPETSSPISSDEQQQLEAERRAKFVYELMIDKAPAAIVGLFGHKEYEQCAKDLYFFIQSSVCLKLLAYDVIELLLLSAIPEMDYVFKQLHDEKHKFGEYKAN